MIKSLFQGPVIAKHQYVFDQVSSTEVLISNLLKTCLKEIAFSSFLSQNIHIYSGGNNYLILE